MQPQNQPAVNLSVSDFTGAVSPIVAYLDHIFEEGDSNTGCTDATPDGYKRRKKLCISDVVDANGSQYVDLVQEGGGVHGIALAGYTYVLEKYGAAFMKMAGTSAGSINTLLLNGVITKDELLHLQRCATQKKMHTDVWNESLQYNVEALNPENYYETRSEKLLEYLAAKPLSDLVDGKPCWRDLLLSTFKGQVDFANVKAYIKLMKRVLVWGALGFVLIFLMGLFLAFITEGSDWTNTVKWIYRGGVIVFLYAVVFLVRQMLKGKMFYKNTERFGVNPGDNFEQWIQTKLSENGINNTSQLKNKLQMERECLAPKYQPCREKGEALLKSANIANTVEASVPANKAILKGLHDVESMTVSSEEAIAQRNQNLSALAKQISPDNADKYDLAGELVKKFTESNMRKYNSGTGMLKTLVAEATSDGDVKTPFDKEIALVASDITNGIKVEFPAMHKLYWGENYTISPARYVRASMAIPLFFKPLRIDYSPTQRSVMEKEWNDLLNIDKRLEDNGYALMVDGGMLSNFPINIFSNPDNPLPMKPTIGIKLEFSDESKPAKIESLGQLAGALISTMRFFYDREFISKHNIFKKTVRSIDTGKIHWLNFDMTDQDKIELFFRGALTAAIFLLGREDEGDRSKGVQYLIGLGKDVKFKEKAFSIYTNTADGEFLTEDNSVENIHFNWCKYKKDRILLLGEQEAMKKRLNRKASFTAAPQSNADQ